jgi:hypothetical protein
MLLLQQPCDVFILARQYSDQLTILHCEVIDEGLFEDLSNGVIVRLFTVFGGGSGSFLGELSFLKLMEFVPHDLTNFKKLRSVQALVLVLLHLHVMQLYHLHKFLDHHPLIIPLKYILS